jgi:DNA-binding NarL/FixJ family response regulator
VRHSGYTAGRFLADSNAMSTIDAERRTEIMERYATRRAEFDRVAAAHRSRTFGIAMAARPASTTATTPLPRTEPPRRGGTEAQARPKLSPREVAVLELVGCGSQNRQIGLMLGISEETVKSHVRSVLGKLGARNRAHMVTLGFVFGYLSLDT